MKSFNEFSLKVTTNKDLFLMLPHKSCSDLHDISEDFYINNIGKIKSGYVIVDLETLLHDDKESFALIKIQDFKLMYDTMQTFCGYPVILKQFKAQYLSKTNEQAITKIA